MNIREVSESLKEISLKSGTATQGDFEGVDPLDIVASYCVALSGGRITEDRDIISRVNGCGNFQHWIGSVSRPSIPVPTKEQIDRVLSGELNEYVPLAPEPSKMEALATYLRRDSEKRRKARFKSMDVEFTPFDPRERWEGHHPQSPRHIANWGAPQIIARYIQQHGSPMYKSGGLLGVSSLVETTTPEEFVQTITGEVKR